ncbi:MAG: DUF11 domain-containing protein, partial [Candidatus Kerfeldbacteria bacterium]|nr:DUF11 domain-containing protein [Candidatus Kerfeldbacteria bacterium]
LTVIKTVDTDGNGTVDQTNATDWTWDLDGGNQNFATGSTQSVITGSHSVSEDNKDNFHNLNYECRDNESEDVVAEGTGTLIPEVDVTTDGVTCVFTNVRDTGTVTLEKIVLGGTAQPSDWSFTIGDTSGYRSGDEVTLPTGDYPISEFGPNGYSFDSASGVCFVPELDRLTTAVTPPMGSAVLRVTTEGGTCTFTNARDMGTVVVHKNVDTDGNGSFDLTSDSAANDLGFRWSLDGSAADRLMGTSENVTTLDNHAINENAVVNYHPVGWFYNDDQTSCADQELNSLPANVTVSKNGTTEITICNARDTAPLTVIKTVDTDGNGTVDQTNATDWTWDLDGGNQNFATGSTQSVVTGSQAVNEDQKVGFHSLGWSCVANDQAQTPLGSGSGEALSVNVPLAGATCTFTNQLNVTTIGLDKQGPATVTAGDNIAYTLAWSVSGNTPATNAVITDSIPTNTTFVSAGCGTTVGTCAVNSATSTISWNLGSRNPGESGTVTLTVKSNSPLTNGTVIANTGTFDTDQTEPVTDTVNTTVSSLPVLGLQKTADPTTVPAGQNVTWTVKWSVSGNAPATSVVITDPIPANSTFVSVADAGVYDAATNKVTWNLGTQTPGASGEVHYVARTANPITNGTVITNTATIDSAETDPAISASAVVTVTSAPDLTITKTSDVATFTNPGKVLTYTVVVTNKATATDTARNVVLTDTLPSGFTFAIDGSTTKSFIIGNLAPGQSATLTYLVNISGTQAAGTYNNLAKAKGDNTNEVTAIAPVEVRVPQVLGVETNPDLTITKTVNHRTTKPGDVVRYTLTIKNVGDGDADNVVITDTLPAGLSFVNAHGKIMTWEIGTLPAGHTRVVNVDVRVNSSAKKGEYENVGAVSADQVPEKLAKAAINVRVPTVLGLATTGTGPLDYLIAFIGTTLLALGILGIRRKHKESPTG